MNLNARKKARAALVGVVIAQLALGPDAAAIESFNLWETMKSVTESVSKGFQKILGKSGKRGENLLKVKEKDYITNWEATGRIPGSPDIPVKEDPQWPDPILGHDGVVDYDLDAATGALRSVAFNPDLIKGLPRSEFLEKFGKALKIDAGKLALNEEARWSLDDKHEAVRLNLSLKGDGGRDVPVVGGSLVLIEKKGWVLSAYSSAISDLTKVFPNPGDLTPTFSEAAAIDAAQAALPADPAEEPELEVEEGEGVSAPGLAGLIQVEESGLDHDVPGARKASPTAELAVSGKDFSTAGKDARLVWVVTFGGGERRVHVTAGAANGGKPGEVLNVEEGSFEDFRIDRNEWSHGVSACSETVGQIPLVTRATTAGGHILQTVLEQAKVGDFLLKGQKKVGPSDPSEANPAIPAAILMLDCRQGKCRDVYETKNNVFGDTSLEGWMKEAVGGYYALQAASNYFCANFKDPGGDPCWKSWDGKGNKEITAFLSSPEKAATSRSIPSQGVIHLAATADQNKGKNICLASVFHEYVHGLASVTTSAVAGGRDDEIGSLLEGLSNFFAVAIRAETLKKAPDWKYGGVDLSQPKFAGFPDTYKGLFYVSGKDCDGMQMCYFEKKDESVKKQIGCDAEGGYCDAVHRNATVFTKAFSLLARDGGELSQGENDVKQKYEVVGIGIKAAEKIAFESLRLMAPRATYVDFRNISVQVAKILFGEQSQQVKSVEAAWRAVNVGPPTSRLVFPTDGLQDVNPWKTGEESAGAELTLELLPDETNMMMVEIAKDPAFVSKVVLPSCGKIVDAKLEGEEKSIATCVHQVTLQPDTEYFWRYRSSKQTAWERTLKFRTSKSKPEIESPASGSSFHPWEDVHVKWKKAEGAEGYTLKLNDHAFEGLEKDDQEAIIPVPSVKRGGKYALKLILNGPNGYKAESDPIAIVPDFSKTKPQILSDGGSVSATADLMIDWADVKKANGYTLQLAKDPGFTQNPQQIPIPDGQSSFLLNADFVLSGPYFWRVRANGPADSEPGDWSITAQVSIKLSDVMTQPIPQAAVPCGATAQLSWNLVPNAKGYLVTVCQKSDNACYPIKAKNNVSSVSIPPHASSQNWAGYKWNVRVIGGDGSIGPPSDWSEYTVTVPPLDVWAQGVEKTDEVQHIQYGADYNPTLLAGGFGMPWGGKSGFGSPYVCYADKYDVLIEASKITAGDTQYFKATAPGGSSFGASAVTMPHAHLYVYATAYKDGMTVKSKPTRVFTKKGGDPEKTETPPPPKPASCPASLAAPQVTVTPFNGDASSVQMVPKSVALGWAPVEGATYRINYITAGSYEALGGLVKGGVISSPAVIDIASNQVYLFSVLPQPPAGSGIMLTVQAKDACGNLSPTSLPVGLMVVP